MRPAARTHNDGTVCSFSPSSFSVPLLLFQENGPVVSLPHESTPGLRWTLWLQLSCQQSLRLGFPGENNRTMQIGGTDTQFRWGSVSTDCPCVHQDGSVCCIRFPLYGFWVLLVTTSAAPALLVAFMALYYSAGATLHTLSSPDSELQLHPTHTFQVLLLILPLFLLL